MRAARIALMLTFATKAGAGCGKLCDHRWWASATKYDWRAELGTGTDIMGRNDAGATPLHWAARSHIPVHIQALMVSGADAKAKNKEGKTLWDFAQDNGELKYSKGYRQQPL